MFGGDSLGKKRPGDIPQGGADIRQIIFVADVRKKRKKQEDDKNYENRAYFLHILHILPYLTRQRKFGLAGKNAYFEFCMRGL